MWIGLVTFLVQIVIQCAVKVTNYKLVSAVTIANNCICSFPEFWTIFRGCVYYKSVECALVREGDGEKESVITTIIVDVCYLTAIVSLKED